VAEPAFEPDLKQQVTVNQPLSSPRGAARVGGSAQVPNTLQLERRAWHWSAIDQQNVAPKSAAHISCT